MSARDVQAYFEDTVVPLIAEKFPEVAEEMSLQILGSYGLGIADELSDLDSAIWLEDDLWKAKGGQVQLLLAEELPRFAVETDHCKITVWPLSWLAERRDFLDPAKEPPWEDVLIEQLFEIQENLVLRDPTGMFRRLREATSPERLPDWVWRKLLITRLKELHYESLPEFRRCLQRGKTTEGSILFGSILTDMLRVGFLINRRYYPWRAHLSWAFSRLPSPGDEVLRHIESAVAHRDGHKRLTEIESVLAIYTDQIASNDLLPTINLLSSDLGLAQELVWAERCKAWADPNWRDWVRDCQERARKAGHSDQWWVWSLWGWR